MNKVTKSDKVPGILIDKGTREIALLRENVAENKPLVFKDQIYADDEVKKQLKSDQFGKCAYCERSLNGDFGAVEHLGLKVVTRLRMRNILESLAIIGWLMIGITCYIVVVNVIRVIKGISFLWLTKTSVILNMRISQRKSLCF